MGLDELNNNNKQELNHTIRNLFNDVDSENKNDISEKENCFQSEDEDNNVELEIDELNSQDSEEDSNENEHCSNVLTIFQKNIKYLLYMKDWYKIIIF